MVPLLTAGNELQQLEMRICRRQDTCLCEHFLQNKWQRLDLLVDLLRYERAARASINETSKQYTNIFHEVTQKLKHL